MSQQKQKMCIPAWTLQEAREIPNGDPIMPAGWLQPYRCLCGGTAWEIRPSVRDEKRLEMCLVLDCQQCGRTVATFAPMYADQFHNTLQDLQEQEDAKPPNERRWHPKEPEAVST